MTQTPARAQSTNSVLMIRPGRFYPNPETAADNAFLRNADRDSEALTPLARKEFDAAVQTLRAVGINVHVFEDTDEPEKPDAVFPNNWISTHHDGRVALFPMYSALRRRERRQVNCRDHATSAPTGKLNRRQFKRDEPRIAAQSCALILG
jgi:hypothetical protein